MKHRKLYFLVSVTLLLSSSILLHSCGDKPGGGGVNFFSLEDDKAFGAQVASEIEGDPTNYPILDSSQYPQAYAYLYAIRDSILE
ncbi:MAG: peptidase M48, partial [Bacteroidia bacterium]|nr:peptidase M48 [Bacteroidia bacterium]